jgi:addiction module RelE/StbE family toxin
MEIRWSEVAIDSLERARAFIAGQNPQAAARVHELVLSTTRRLSDNDTLGRPGRVEGTRELVVPRTRYIIAYTVFRDSVIILAVQHDAQKWPERF